MSQQQMFEEILTGEPPARDTLDALVRRSRRGIRRRRLTAAGAGLAAAGIVAVLVAQVPRAAAPAVTGAPPTIGPSSPARHPDILLGGDPTEPAEAATQRLITATVGAVNRVVPATVTVAPLVERQVTPANTPDNPGPLPSTLSYQLTATVTVAGVTGTLVVTVKRARIAAGCAAAYSPSLQPSVLRIECAPADDQAQPVTIETVRAERPGMIRLFVWLDRHDGTAVGVSVSNEPALTGAPPLTGEQIAEIARDARFTLYP